MERIIHGEQARLEQPARLPTAAVEEAPVLRDRQQPGSSSDRSSAFAIFEPDHVTAVDVAGSMIGEQLDSSVGADLECPLTPSRNMDVQEVEPWTPDGSPPVVTEANRGSGWAEVTPLVKRRRQ